MSKYITANNKELFLSATPTNWIPGSGIAETQTGSAKSDIFQGSGADRLVGGAGDDSYYLWDNKSTIVEKAGEGVDTIYANYWGAATLPDYVENLVLGSAGSTSGTGNALNNIIIAGTAGATLDGKVGDDVLVGGSGADLFKVAAGNGSDAILNFGSGSDVIQLSGYGIANYDQLKSLGTQVGSDVKFDFSNGESLVIRDVKLAGLTAYDFGMKPATSAALNGGEAQMVGASQHYASHGYGVLNNVWNPGSMVAGADYTIDSTFNKADLSAGTTFSWSFPVVTDLYSPIRAYPEVILGYSPFDTTKFTPKSEGFNPVQVSDVSSLVLDYDVSYRGNVSGFNVAFDIFFTSELGGGASTITNELMIWVHKGSFDPYGKVLGTYSNGDITGKIYVDQSGSANYIALVLDKDAPQGSIDTADVLVKLQEMGLVSANEYIATIQLGAEVTSGGGSLTINDLDVTVTTANDDGSSTVRDITGTGTTVTEVAVKQAPTIDDIVAYDANATTIQGGDGNDTLVLKTGLTVDLGSFHSSQVASGHTYVSGFENVDGAAATASVTVNGSDYNNKIFGSHFGDVLLGGAGWDEIHGNGGADYLDGGADGDRLYGDAGDDRIVYDAADYVIDGGAGRDMLILKTGTTVDLNNFSSSMVATGTAYVTGFEDADASSASSGATMKASQYGSTLTGSAFSDTLLGNAGCDVINGGAGNDYIDGGVGGDRLYGGAGDDRIVYDAVDYVIDGGAGNDTLILNTAATVNLGSFSSSQVIGGNAYVTGFEDVDASGANGGVTLIGSQYNNKMIGSAFNDIISSGGGSDSLTGGGGGDIFRFTQFTSGQISTITDFSSAQGDKIDLSGIDAVTGGQRDAFSFIGAHGFNHVAGELRFGTASGGVMVQGDTDGDGDANFSIFVATASLNQHDFVLA
jgi:serralysin